MRAAQVDHFRRISMAFCAKDVYLLPSSRQKGAPDYILATGRSAGTRWVGRYDNRITTQELLDDVLFTIGS